MTTSQATEFKLTSPPELLGDEPGHTNQLPLHLTFSGAAAPRVQGPEYPGCYDADARDDPYDNKAG